LKVKAPPGVTIPVALFASPSQKSVKVKVASELKIDRSTYETLQVLGISLLDKTPVNELFEDLKNENFKDLNCNQLKINLF
jgi:hypothetical protein